MSRENQNYGNTLANLFDESKMDKASIIRHMDTFTRRVKQKNIDKKYDKIIREFAGDFSLDAERVNTWINSQHNGFRRAVCSTLVKHHKYYSINETIELMDTSVKECLSKSKFRDSQKYIILLHDDKPKINDAPAGSILMFSIIGYTLLLKTAYLTRIYIFPID